MKPCLRPPVLLAAMLAAWIACGGASPSPEPPAAAPGTLEGVVHFVGTPCPPDGAEIPPCDGPYAAYEVTIHEPDGVTVAAEVSSDETGRYRVDLPPGEYVVFTPSGPGPDGKTRHDVSIQSGQTTQHDLKIDTGVR